jgi:hypothetical protein
MLTIQLREMKNSKLIISTMLLLISHLSGAQCDTLFKDPIEPEGFRLNTQSYLSEIAASDDLEINMILAGGRQYEFQVIGHRAYEVFLKSNLGLDAELEEKMEKKVVLTNETTSLGVFRIQPTSTQRIYLRFFGVLGEEGKECTGVIVYEKN